MVVAVAVAVRVSPRPSRPGLAELFKETCERARETSPLIVMRHSLHQGPVILSVLKSFVQVLIVQSVQACAIARIASELGR